MCIVTFAFLVFSTQKTRRRRQNNSIRIYRFAFSVPIPTTARETIATWRAPPPATVAPTSVVTGTTSNANGFTRSRSTQRPDARLPARPTTISVGATPSSSFRCSQDATMMLLRPAVDPSPRRLLF